MEKDIPTEDAIDREILSVVTYEWEWSDKEKNEEKISERLKRMKLGHLPEDRLQLLRKLRKETEKEINRHDCSDFWAGRHDKKYAHIDDFDKGKMKDYFLEKYPDVSSEVMEHFMGFAVFNYYLR